MPSPEILRPHRLMPPFAHAQVMDVMRHGLISCPPDTPFEQVARIMASNRIHAVVVSALGAPHDEDSAWGIVSDLDMARLAGRTEGQTAGSVASTKVATVAADETLERAAQVMAEHEVSHLIVTHAATGHPVGVLSTLDLASVLGGV